MAAGTVASDYERAIRVFFHDCEPSVASRAASRLRPQATTPMLEITPLTAWPRVPATYVLGRHDRILNPDWSRRAVPRRLGVVPAELDCGHSPFLACPDQLVEVLCAASAVP